MHVNIRQDGEVAPGTALTDDFGLGPMLKLPEVITIRDQMRSGLPGKQVGELSVVDKASLDRTIRSSLITQTEATFREALLEMRHYPGEIQLRGGSLLYMFQVPAFRSK